MNRTLRNTLAAAVAGGAVIALPAVALGAVTGSGASFPATAYSQWCQESGLCSYTSKGSTGGINDLINGVVDFAASDAPLSPQQLGDLASKRGGAKPLYFPTLLGAVTVPTHIDGVSKGINLDGATVADIFRGAITNWSDARIRTPNPGVRFPNASITVCVRSDGSGTSYNFTNYLSKVSPSFRAAIGASQQPNWSGSVIKSPRNPGVAQCIKSNSNSIGYVDISDARDAGLTNNFSKIGKSELVVKKVKRKGRTVTIRTRGRVYILPSPGSTAKAANLPKFKGDLTVDLTASPAKGAYPIAITTWVLAYSNYGGAGKSSSSRDGVKQMLGYFYSPKAQGELTSLRFAPLPATLVKAAKAQISQIK